MKEIAVVGRSEFVVGFQLAGIRNIVEIEGSPMAAIDNLKKNNMIGIVILDEKALEDVSVQKRLEIEDSVEPVFIPVSEKAEHGSLKRLIKKSIGVDLWK